MTGTTQAHFVDGMRLQYAGETGFLSLGINKLITENYQLSFLYGYTPNTFSEKVIETIALKQDYFFSHNHYRKYHYDFYTGLNIYHVIGIRYQSSRAGESPDNYYPIASIKGLFYLGLEAYEREMPSRYYFEMGMNDTWILNYIQNSDVLDARDYVSLAIGYKYLFQ